MSTIYSPFVFSALDTFKHAKEHFSNKTPRDQRFAVIHLDNTVELMFKDLMLRWNIDYEKEFHDLFTIVRSRNRLVANLSWSFQFLHSTRNLAYHGGISPGDYTVEWGIGLVRNLILHLYPNLNVPDCAESSSIEHEQAMKYLDTAVDAHEKSLLTSDPEEKRLYQTLSLTAAVNAAYLLLALRFRQLAREKWGDDWEPKSLGFLKRQKMDRISLQDYINGLKLLGDSMLLDPTFSLTIENLQKIRNIAVHKGGIAKSVDIDIWPFIESCLTVADKIGLRIPQVSKIEAKRITKITTFSGEEIPSVLQRMLIRSKRRVFVASSFIDQELLKLVISFHKAGKNVKVICRSIIGKKSPAVIQAVEEGILRFNDRLHVKMIIIDDSVIVGSANLALKQAPTLEMSIYSNNPKLVDESLRFFKNVWVESKARAFEF